MKKPKSPTEPIKPHKPSETKYQTGETITGTNQLATSSDLSDGDSVSLATLLEKVDPLVLKSLSIDDIHIRADITWDYGDSYYSRMELSIFTYKELPNPNMEKEQKRWTKDNEKYEEALVKYKVAKKEYNVKLKAYEEELKKWQIWQAKQTLKELGAE